MYMLCCNHMKAIELYTPIEAYIIITFFFISVAPIVIAVYA